MKLLEFAGDRSGHLTPSQATEFLPLSADEIRTRCATGEIPSINISRTSVPRYKIHRDQIRAWLRNHEAAS